MVLENTNHKTDMSTFSKTASKCFVFMYFLLPTGYRPHGAAGHKPVSRQSCRPGNCPPHGYGGESSGSAAQSHPSYGKMTIGRDVA